MRTIALILAGVLTFLIILISFQNVTTMGRVVMLFGEMRAPLMLPLLLVGVLGLVAGVLYAVSIRAMIDHAKKLAEDESEPDPF